MKKRLSISLIVVLIVIMIIPIIATGCTKRENTLKIYNCFDYIDEEVLNDFKLYYKQVTGENLKIVYDAYETNESMHSKIALKKSDYDVVVASEYMIERMIRENLLIALDKELGNDINGQPIETYYNNISPFFLSGSEKFSYDEGNKFSVPYMWGTMGILYAKDKVSLNYLEQNGWDALWDTNYAKKIAMKLSVRDTFAIGAIKTYKQEILSGQMTPEEALNKIDDVSKIKEALINQKRTVECGYETDQGKSDIINGKYDMILQWSGDAVYAMGDLQDELNVKRELDYFVPNEGSNIWVDSWAIPKYAQNKKAANLFINFLCREDIAIKNMDYIGYTSAVATAETLKYATGYWDENDNYVPYTPEDYDYSDLSYFFTGDLANTASKIITFPVMFPSKDVVDRCGVMKDFGNKTNIIDELWSAIISA